MRSDKELVVATLDGDRSAYAILVQRYEKLVCAAAMSILENRCSAEDVAQDTFVAAFENIRTLRKKEAFGPWVLQIARRSAYRAARRKHEVRPLTEDVASRNDNGHLSEMSHHLLRALERLPKHERIVIMLKYFDDLTAQEVASMTGRSVGTVTKQLTRARARLRHWVKEWEK